MSSFPNIEGAKLEALLDYLRTGKDPGKGTNLASDAGPQAAVTPASGTSGAPDTDLNAATGAKVYEARCSQCHGASREGNAPAFPTLIGIGQRMNTAQVKDLVLKGKGGMPAFSTLHEDQIDSLLRYLGVSAETDDAEQEDPYTITGYTRFDDSDGYPAVAPPWGTLNAIDLNTGKYLWKLPLGEYPELAAKGIKNTGTENYGGPIVTAGGLVIIAATDFDRKIRAFNSRTGELLWEGSLPFSGVATPATYMVDGKQYIVIATCGARDPKSRQGAVYVAFALP
jgi:mono/diheme cytochrome c family protein